MGQSICVAMNAVSPDWISGGKNLKAPRKIFTTLNVTLTDGSIGINIDMNHIYEQMQMLAHSSVIKDMKSTGMNSRTRRRAVVPFSRICRTGKGVEAKTTVPNRAELEPAF